MMKKLLRFSPWGLAVAMVAVTVWLMAFEDADYMRKIESLQIFLPTSQFFSECMHLPGGMLAWMSLWLTQSFHYPWLGTLVYLLLFAATISLTIKAFRLSDWALPAMLLIPAMELLALHNLGYVIFSLKTPGYAFLLPLGVLVTVAVAWGYNRMAWWGRLAGIAVVACCGYMLLGFYGILATAVCCTTELRRIFTDHTAPKWHSIVPLAVGAVLAGVVPQIVLTQWGGHMRLESIYSVQLPWIYEGEDSLLYPYYIVAVTILLAALAESFTKGKRILPTLSIAIGLCSVVSVFYFRYNDPNFRLTLQLDRALWQGDWKKAIELKEAAHDIEPTRLNVFLTDCALIQTGEAADRMFALRQGSAPYTTQRSLRAAHDAGAALLSFYTGLVNYAYHWAMENKVEYGLSVDVLKMMVKCALINEDFKLAEKYLDNLEMTAFHGEWAKRYRKMLNNPDAVDNDEELGTVSRRVHHDNVFLNDGGRLEGYIWKYWAEKTTGTVKMLELAMIGCLKSVNLDKFATFFPAYAQEHEHIPVHFQEAILMWAHQNDMDATATFNLDPYIVNRFERLKQVMVQYRQYGEQSQRNAVHEMFGDTYWDYGYFKVGELTVI